MRFSEGIYHEDHDFGTLLFCLASKVAYTNEALYIYRQRANSTMTSYKNTAFPAKMPYFLEPLKKDFKDYKALRAYFKAYCFVLVAFRIYEFYKSKQKPQKQYFKSSIMRYIKPYIDDFHKTQNFYSQKAGTMLSKMGYTKFWRYFLRIQHYFWRIRQHFLPIYSIVRSYCRHPKKFLQIFGLKKDKSSAKS